MCHHVYGINLLNLFIHYILFIVNNTGINLIMIYLNLQFTMFMNMSIASYTFENPISLIALRKPSINILSCLYARITISFRIWQRTQKYFLLLIWRQTSRIYNPWQQFLRSETIQQEHTALTHSWWDNTRFILPLTRGKKGEHVSCNRW